MKNTDLGKQILDAAESIFLKDGFEKISIRKIAEKINHSPGVIYLYFKNKDDLFYALHQRGFEKFYHEYLKITHVKEPKQKLIEYGKLYLKFAFENQEYYDLMFIKSAPTKNMIESHNWESGSETYDGLKNDVENYLKTKGITNQEQLDQIAFGLWSLVHGMASLVIRKRVFAMPNCSIDLDFIYKSFEILSDQLLR